ncbi:MAG: zf-HC2 domain-containing protein [Acidobacteriota bacterium]
MSSLTCKDFLSELNDYLDEASREELRNEIEAHLAACPNCWVICDTTKKTVQIYKGTEFYPLPEDVQARLKAALEKTIAGGKR